ncbi:MAG: DNA recombination protein RmuC [Methylococcales bacterium]|nr:DNA recombination protein RmuC [Methylococcales bacterium]
MKSGEFLDIFSYLIDNTNVLTALGLGAVLGLLIMGLWSQRTRRELEQSLLIAKEKLVILDERSQLCEAQQEELTRAHILTAQLQARLEEQQKHGSEKLKLLQDAEAQLKLQFESLANQIFDTKSKQFKEQNNQSLNEIVSPLKDQLGDFKKRIEHVYEHETRDRVTLREEISQLRQDTQKMNQEALNLTRALKGDNKTQGNWGEMILEKVLEESGLRKGVEYDPQGSFRDDDNSLFKPDVIIRLPGDKDVVVDSKVSLIAYERYCSTEDDAERVKALKEHSLAVRQHIKGLSEKDYSSLKGLRSLDFVLLFIPIESAFIAAFQADEKVFADAFEHKIVVVTPTTLLATLRTIENIWRYERRNENARIIAEKAGALYDKIRGFVEDLDKLGTQLSTVNKTYDGVMNKLTLGQGNLIRQASSFVELGVQVKKTIPKKISEQATLEDEES